MKTILSMAPVKGTTDHIYRTVYTRYYKGFSSALAPFITAKRSHLFLERYLKEFTPPTQDQIPVIPQILTKDGDFFQSIAAPLALRGYKEINLNMGCPYPMALNQNKGAGLLPHIDLVDALLQQISTRDDFQLSVKCRLGIDDPEEIFKLIPLFNKYPLKQVIIHPRTAKQMYKGNVNIDAFKECASQSQHPVIYNGDIFSIEDFQSLQNSLPDQQNWMLGRGAVITPTLPGEITDGILLNNDERKNKFQQFHNDLLQTYSDRLSGEKHLLDRMVALWFFWSQGLPHGKKVMKRIKKLHGIGNYKEVVKNIISEF